jgi:hypothetical protein
MVYKRRPQSKTEQLIVTVFVTIILLGAGLALLRFVAPDALNPGVSGGVKFIELPGKADPDLEGVVGQTRK